MDKSWKIKTLLSVVMLVACAFLTIFAVSNNVEAKGTVGVIVDFGDGNTVFTNLGDRESTDAQLGLEIACGMYEKELIWDGNEVRSIGSFVSDDTNRWDLYFIEKSKAVTVSPDWKKYNGDPKDILVEDYVAVSWAYCADGEIPSNALDSTGFNFYGYERIEKIVSLAPSCTEVICSMGGERKIIGTDSFSNYPVSVGEARDRNEIKDIGGYSNPNYEKIVSLKPDLVVCIDAQYLHLKLAEKLRSAGFKVVVCYGGEDLDSVMENLIMTGTAMGARDKSIDVVGKLRAEINTVKNLIQSISSAPKSGMITLSVDKSPWTSGSDTYASDALNNVGVKNSFSSESGWVMINSEFLVDKRVDYVIVVNVDGPRNQSEYESLVESLGEEWKATEAYSNGRIYFLTDFAADLASRPGPRISQFFELLGRILQDQAFGTELPKFIGNEYHEYLTYSKDPVLSEASS